MKKDPNKPRGKMTSYAFFVTTCREEHKKKHPTTPVGFAEFSKKCSERWRVSFQDFFFHLKREKKSFCSVSSTTNVFHIFLLDDVVQGEGEV